MHQKYTADPPLVLPQIEYCTEAVNSFKVRPVVVWLRDRPGDQRVAGLIPESTDFLTNSSGQATKALVSLFTKQ